MLFDFLSFLCRLYEPLRKLDFIVVNRSSFCKII